MQHIEFFFQSASDDKLQEQFISILEIMCVIFKRRFKSISSPRKCFVMF